MKTNRLKFLKKKLEIARKVVEELEEKEGMLTDDCSLIYPYLKVAKIEGQIKELKNWRRRNET